jgi:hypothetical protein
MKYGTRHDVVSHSTRAAAAHELSLSIQNDKAVHVVAAMASDVEDCLELFAMLGLDPHGTGLTTESSLLA